MTGDSEFCLTEKHWGMCLANLVFIEKSKIPQYPSDMKRPSAFPVRMSRDRDRCGVPAWVLRDSDWTVWRDSVSVA